MDKLRDMGISLDAISKRRVNPEDKCKQYVKKHLAEGIECWHPKDEGRAGIPDARYWDAKNLWVEYKFTASLPQRASTIIKPKWNSELQLRTCNQFSESGDNVRVVLFWEPEEAKDVRDTMVFVFKNRTQWEFGVPCDEVRVKSMTIAAYIRKLNQFLKEPKNGTSKPTSQPTAEHAGD